MNVTAAWYQVLLDPEWWWLPLVPVLPEPEWWWLPLVPVLPEPEWWLPVLPDSLVLPEWWLPLVCSEEDSELPVDSELFVDSEAPVDSELAPELCFVDDAPLLWLPVDSAFASPPPSSVSSVVVDLEQ